jgi:hypothetical protein
MVERTWRTRTQIILGHINPYKQKFLTFSEKKGVAATGSRNCDTRVGLICIIVILVNAVYCFIILNRILFYSHELLPKPITVAARSKAVFSRPNAGIVGSIPNEDIAVCALIFCICVVLCVGSGIATGRSSVQGVLPTVCRIKNLKKRPRSDKGL